MQVAISRSPASASGDTGPSMVQLNMRPSSVREPTLFPQKRVERSVLNGHPVKSLSGRASRNTISLLGALIL